MRTLLGKNGTITEVDFSKYYTGTDTVTMIAGQDAIYIGSQFAFNKFYVKMVTPNTNSVNISIKYYSSNGFESAVDVNDETEGFTKDGYVEFTPNKKRGWNLKDTEDIDELETKIIYEMYWMKLEFDADTTATEIKFIGNIFASDADLYAEYPQFEDPRFLEAFKSGKTEWEEQRYVATELIFKDLKARGTIQTDEGQILDKDDLTLLCVSKTAELGLVPFTGEGYQLSLATAKKEYMDRLNKSFPTIDKNNNGLIDKNEAAVNVGELYR